MVWTRERPDGGKEVLLFDGTVDRLLFTLTSAGVVAPANAVSPQAFNDAITALQAAVAAVPVIPSGVIVQWSGSILAIPDGWSLCNGANGTPDLRDKFVIGAGGKYPVANQGGRESFSEVIQHTHGVGTLNIGVGGRHNHGVNDPGHTHSFNETGIDRGDPYDFETGRRTGVNPSVVPRTTGARATGITLVDAPDHGHAITGQAAQAGTVASINILPPYYAMAFIMKL
jgi:hypothetical protein